MRHKVRKVILAIILIIVMTAFFLLYSDIYKSSSEEFQDLYFAIGLAVAGIVLHVLKNNSKFEKQRTTMDSSILLMLIMSPTYVSFKILRETFDGNPYAIIIPTIIALSVWYLITIIQTSKLESNDEKSAYSITMLIYWSFILALIPFIWLAMQPRS